MSGLILHWPKRLDRGLWGEGGWHFKAKLSRDHKILQLFSPLHLEFVSPLHLGTAEGFTKLLGSPADTKLVAEEPGKCDFSSASTPSCSLCGCISRYHFRWGSFQRKAAIVNLQDVGMFLTAARGTVLHSACAASAQGPLRPGLQCSFCMQEVETPTRHSAGENSGVG